MIRLRNILLEISEEESSRLLSKIRNKEYTFLAKGDNGKVYTLKVSFKCLYVPRIFHFYNLL